MWSGILSECSGFLIISSISSLSYLHFCSSIPSGLMIFLLSISVKEGCFICLSARNILMSVEAEFPLLPICLYLWTSTNFSSFLTSSPSWFYILKRNSFKLNFQLSLLQSSESTEIRNSEIILIGAKETFLIIIINVENRNSHIVKKNPPSY